MKMTHKEAHNYIKEELVPIVKVSSPRVYSILSEDFEALEIAFESGNTSLVFAMANYISNVEGLMNGTEIGQKIASKVFEN